MGPEDAPRRELFGGQPVPSFEPAAPDRSPRPDPGQDEGPPELTPVQRYIGWASAYFNEEAKFGELKDTYPELRAPARRFDGTIAAFHLNHMVVVAFKTADTLGSTGAAALLNHLYDMVPSAGQFDALAYYGLLVLVYEKPIPPRLRDHLIGQRRKSMFGGKVVQLVLVELDAKAVWTSNLPRVITPIFQPIHDALGRKDKPPEIKPPPPRVGQRGRTTGVAWVTLAIIVACVLVEVAVTAKPDSMSDSLRKYQFGLGKVNAIAAGEWWRLITSSFLHADATSHLFGNICGLMVYGMTVEELFGSGWAMAAFFLTATSGSVLSYWLLPAYGGYLGASGGVFGYFGMLVAVYAFKRGRITPRTTGFLIRGTVVYLGWVILAPTIFSGIGWLFSGHYHSRGTELKEMFIDNNAHLGGWVTGFLLGVLIPLPERGKPTRVGAIAGMASALVCVAAFAEMAGHMDWRPTDYTRVGDGEVFANYDVPEGWVALEPGKTRSELFADVTGIEGRGRISLYTNGVNGFLALAWADDRIDGIVNEPGYALRNIIGEDLRKSYNRSVTRGFVTYKSELEDFEAARRPVGGGVGVVIKSTIRETLSADYAGLWHSTTSDHITMQLILLPCTTGYLGLYLMYEPEDEGYFRPILAQIEATLEPREKVSTPASAFNALVQ